MSYRLFGEYFRFVAEISPQAVCQRQSRRVGLRRLPAAGPAARQGSSDARPYGMRLQSPGQAVAAWRERLPRATCARRRARGEMRRASSSSSRPMGDLPAQSAATQAQPGRLRVVLGMRAKSFRKSGNVRKQHRGPWLAMRCRCVSIPGRSRWIRQAASTSSICPGGATFAG